MGLYWLLGLVFHQAICFSVPFEIAPRRAGVHLSSLLGGFLSGSLSLEGSLEEFSRDDLRGGISLLLRVLRTLDLSSAMMPRCSVILRG